MRHRENKRLPKGAQYISSIAKSKPRPPHFQANTIFVIQAIKDKLRFIVYVVKQMQNKDGHSSGVMYVFLIHYYWISFLFFVLVKLISTCILGTSALEYSFLDEKKH